MATDEQTVETGDPAPSPSTSPAEPTSETTTRSTPPNWWHRDHPTFAALSGFFTGLVCVLVVPTLFAGIIGAVFGSNRIGDLFPLVLVLLAVPLVLLVVPRTRRFGSYMWVGILTTAVVVVGVGALVFWFMITFQS